MQNAVFEFLKRHTSLLLTTHDPADPDGLGAEMLFLLLAKSMGKKVRIINSSPIPELYRYMDVDNTVESWKNVGATLPRDAAMVIFDTADEYHIGDLRDIIPFAKEVFVIDHHEHNEFSTFRGYIDSTASSTCELMVELALTAGIKLTPEYATAAYSGIVYDSGFFAYPKTSARTFRAALALVEAGVNPNKVYQIFNGSASTEALLLEKSVLSTLEIRNHGKVAIQILRKSELEKNGAAYEDAKLFINTPMKSREIEVSIMVKEPIEGNLRCSLRSKGNVNVAKLAQTLGGGGHATAAGFRSSRGLNETIATILEKVSEALENRY
jgi:phosphoesterase RecJ-like protein